MDKQNIKLIGLDHEMKSSYLDYSMSVIVSRALPDVRDGLKPVHRRIIYAMFNQNLYPDRPFSKSTRLTGEVMAKYHPHGDGAIYDAIVRLAQDFNIRYPLIEGQGNFGSIDGDGAAAPRYTELRMENLTLELLRDIQKQTVDFVDNYDGREKEPVVLPSRFPNLLVNGAAGIAVGMATNMAPHNLGEVIDATCAMIKNPDITVEELQKYIKGPDFPTGGEIIGVDGIKSAYRTGRGKIRMRAVAEIVKEKEKETIVITEIPYQVNKANLIQKIAELSRDKVIEGISYLRDASDRTGLKIIIQVKRDANARVVLNNLYKHTQLQTTFGVINLCLVDGVPQILSLPQLLRYYIDHQIDVVKRRTLFDLKKAQDRAHIVEGLLKAIDNIDEVIHIIRTAYADAKERLMERFQLSEIQAQAILDMRLKSLQGLEREKLDEEYQSLLSKIAYLSAILEDHQKLLDLIIEEMQEIKKKYGDARRTSIYRGQTEFEIDELIQEEDVVITLTESGYIKRTNVSQYRVQNRGGKGVTGLTTKEEDQVEKLITTSTHNTLMFFTSLGRVYTLKAFHIPEGGRTAKGQAIVNLLPLLKDEKITTILPTDTEQGQGEDDTSLIMLTRNGTIKKVEQSLFSNIRKSGLFCIKLDDEDELIGVITLEGEADILIATRQAKAIVIGTDELRGMGRQAKGVRAIRLDPDDEVVSFGAVNTADYLLLITENGYGKNTEIKSFSRQKRGGRGVKTYTLTKKTGPVIKAMLVREEDEILLISKKGDLLRIKVNSISTQGRYAKGVKVKDVETEEDKIVTATKYIEDQEV